MKKIVMIILAFSFIVIPAWAQMWEIGQMPIPGFDNARLVRAYGDYCYVSKYASQLIVADVNNPALPFSVSQLMIPNLHGYITIAENTLYVSGGSFSQTVYVIDISDPTNIVMLSQTPTLANSSDLEARGDYLYVCGYGNGLVVYDITDRINPVEVNRIAGIGNVYGIKCSENYIYLGVASQGLKIYDITEPDNPQFVSYCYIPNTQYPIITKDKDYVYFASYTNGHDIVDVSNPSNPILLNTVNPYSLNRYIEFSNDRLFFGNWATGAMMYDISNVGNPQLLTIIPPLYSGTMDVHVCGGNLFVADLSHLRIMAYTDNGDAYYRKIRVPFNWIDITFIGDFWALGDDTFTPRIPIGFHFPYYDNLYGYLHVCSNGFVSFNNFSPSYWDTPIPCDTQPNDIIAPFWDNFNPTGSPMNVFTKLLEDPMRFVIEFVDMPRVGAVNEFETFEVILYPNGDIIFQYPTVVDASSATAGIENETGTRGTQWIHNYTAPIPDSIAIGFRRLGITEGNGVEIFEFAEDFADFEEYDNSEEFDNFPQTEAIPSELAVSASPNPFNPNTTVSYQLPQAGMVTISAYNVLGRREAVLVDEHRNAGAHSVEWNASNLSSGIYFIVIQANGNSHTLRTLLMK